MKYAKLINRLNNQAVAMLPEYHKAILESASEIIAGDFCMEDLFDDVPPMFEEKGNVAVININGIILPTCSKFEKMLGACSCKDIRAAIKQAKASKADNVIFNICSAGGVVQGIKETAKAIQDLNKTKDTVTYCDDLMASAAYWLGAQSKTVLCSESAEVGSIGVYLAIVTMEKCLAMQGIEANVIQAGKYKTLGIACKDLTDEEKAYLQEGVNATYEEFKASVASRGLDDSTMQGECYEGEQAVSLKLVDGIVNDMGDLVTLMQ